jgi:hypothetical protein
MKIPIFVSCPTALSERKTSSRKMILHELECANPEPRTSGRDDYATELPLREVLMLARNCSGGVILGFKQIRPSDAAGSMSSANKKALSGVFSKMASER